MHKARSKVQKASHHMHDYFCNYTDKQQLVVRTGGKQLVVNQDRNIPKKKCMGSHRESNPRPPTLAVNALTTEL